VSRSRQSPELRALLEAVGPSATSQMGGSLKTIEVARGSVNLFLCPPTSTMHLWDLCAPSVILAEAGGRLTDAHGRPIDYAQHGTANRNGVVAASAVVHETVIKRIAPLLG
jgi:3'(2'), 5'-bisphosphate nucleotidase